MAKSGGNSRNSPECSLMSPEVERPAGARHVGTVQVRDGRAVGFAEWGDANGAPVVVFHGGPGSRLLALGCEDAAVDFGLRLVCLERPGFGLSDPAPDRTLIGWADDVVDATRALNIETLTVVGTSAGSAYALACGACLPSLIQRVGVIGGVAPPRLPLDDPFGELVARDRHEAEAAARRHFEAMAADVDASVAEMAARAGPDRAVYSRPDVQERFRETRREAFRNGIDGAVVDLLLVYEPWDFELRDIDVATQWWHGSLDPIVALQTVREATAGMRDIELTVFENEGHAIGFAHGAEILALLAQQD
jgi:pimeloyl-ACP methyl ester carboxylesterase